MAESTSDDVLNMSGKSGLKLDVAQIPEILMDNTDRNRTSPFAFTGNRFEFRAVGELRFGNDRIKCGGSLSIARL